MYLYFFGRNSIPYHHKSVQNKFLNDTPMDFFRQAFNPNDDRLPRLITCPMHSTGESYVVGMIVGCLLQSLLCNWFSASTRVFSLSVHYYFKNSGDSKEVAYVWSETDMGEHKSVPLQAIPSVSFCL
jgi:hypothetical protein